MEASYAQVGGQSVLILREGTTRSRGREAQRANITAAKVVAETGPAGSAVISVMIDQSGTGGQNRITELMEMLDADCYENRLTAVKTLATKTDNPKVIAALRNALQDENAQVRRVAEEFFARKQIGD